MNHLTSPVRGDKGVDGKSQNCHGAARDHTYIQVKYLFTHVLYAFHFIINDLFVCTELFCFLYFWAQLHKDELNLTDS